jgi:hypothetical protein
VSSETTLTVALATTDPVLSVTVPKKLPVACPYRSGPTENANVQKTAFISILIVNITTAFLRLSL